eukprot:1194730-Prorocentrum_minimum.AAC.6
MDARRVPHGDSKHGGCGAGLADGFAAPLSPPQVDGPSHYASNRHTILGKTAARNNALRARGYTLLCVPYFEWDRMVEHHEDLSAYLVHRMDQAVDLVHRMDQAVDAAHPAAHPAAHVTCTITNGDDVAEKGKKAPPPAEEEPKEPPAGEGGEAVPSEGLTDHDHDITKGAPAVDPPAYIGLDDPPVTPEEGEGTRASGWRACGRGLMPGQWPMVAGSVSNKHRRRACCAQAECCCGRVVLVALL